MNARMWLFASILVVAPAAAADWPQWRGPNRDAKATGFEAPATWPKTLTKKWSVKIGDGVATPALVGDKLYTFSRQDGDEIIRCLNTADGKELWNDKNPAAAPRRAGRRISGATIFAGRGGRQGSDAGGGRAAVLLRRRHRRENLAQERQTRPGVFHRQLAADRRRPLHRPTGW